MKIGSFKRSLTAAALGAALGWGPSALFAAVIPVTNLTDSDPGSLRAAIAAAASGDTVDATGIAGTILLASELNVVKSLTINGPGQDVLILSGNHATRVLHLSLASSTVTLSGLTVADGYQASAPGPDDNGIASGGIFSRATLTVSHCTIRGNSILSGANWWAAGGIASLGPLTVSYCTVTQNHQDSGYGGGIAARSSLSAPTTIANSTIDQNGPGGVYDGGSGGEFNISQCTISGNTWTGLAIFKKHTVDRCTVSGHLAEGFQLGQAGKIVNSTIVGNYVGISANPSSGAGVIGNTILANNRNSGGEGGGSINNKQPISLGYNLCNGTAGGDGSTGPGGWLDQPTDVRNTDPLLGPLQNNGGPTFTHALLAGSPALNAGGASSEVQQVFVRGSAGTFTLTFNGQTTVDLPFDATAAQVQAALQALSSIGGVGASVVVTFRDAGYLVSFGGTFGGLDQPQMTGSSSGLSFFGMNTVSDGGALPAVDQRGFPRVVDGQVDIGAFEFQAPPCDIPTVTITGPTSGAVFAANTAVTFTATFTGDSGPHTAQWNIDGNVVAGTVNESAHTVTATVTFSAAGVYSVQLTVSNECGNSATAATVSEMPAMVVLYDPSAGFVTGGGWIHSPGGASVQYPTAVGKASFGFVSKYKKGMTVPTGETEFQFKAGNLKFNSTSYEWLVVSGARAQYKGAGTINGVPGYDFLLTAIDGQVSGGGGADKFRIKIWNSGGVVYDNQMGADDSATPSTGLGGGSIVIQK